MVHCGVIMSLLPVSDAC